MARIPTKAQSWSFDIILGVIIFIAAFFVVYLLLKPSQSTKANILNDEASIVIKQIASEDAPLKVVNGNEVDIIKLNELKNLTYDEIKRRFRVEGDFCIYFEDEKGYFVVINNSYRGIGASTINLSGIPCSQK